MTPDELDEAIRELLDTEGRTHPDGGKSAEMEAAVLDDVLPLLDVLDEDPRERAAAIVHRVAIGTRRSRRKLLRENVDYVLDGLTDDGAYVDPLLDLLYPIGTPDGQVKTLRYWKREDFATSVQMGYRKAADATAAARRWDETAQRAIENMDATGRVHFGPRD